MSSTAAPSGLVVFLLSASVIQGQDSWRVTYTPTEVCAFKGSSVDISCSYRYPPRINDLETQVVETFWFTKESNGVYVDLRTDPEYSGRVTSVCEDKVCSLRITDLRESDSAEYKFRFTTNQQDGKLTGSPGVSLSVTDLQVKVSRFSIYSYFNWAELTCQSSCRPPGDLHYVWFKNGQNIKGQTSKSYSDYFNPADSVSCAVRGYEDFSSPSVYAPKLPSVSVSSFAEIVEDSSVNLTCSSDANPAASYTWYKENQPLLSEGPQLVFSSIKSSDSGEFYCEAENQLGTKRSDSISIDVKYAPRLPSVSVSPSAEIVEGSSVNLTCSSDANPAANYTWYKEDEDSPKASGQIFIITFITAEHSGNYSCEAQNTRGRRNSTLYLIVVAGSLKHAVAGTIPVILLAVISLSVFLWIRKKGAFRDSSESEERPDNIEQCLPDQGQQQQGDLQYASIHFSNNRADPLYSNIGPARPLRHTEQQEVAEYAAVKFNMAPRIRGGEDPSALYSTVNKTR